MQRIFLSLACVSMLLLLANAVLGLSGSDFNRAFHDYQNARHHLTELEKDRSSPAAARTEATQTRDAAFQHYQQTLPMMNAHFYLGVTATLVTILVCSISVTYFVGTSKWSREVVDTYHLAPELADESARIKRRSFPWSVFGMLTMVVVAALGGAADPRGANFARSDQWVQPHFLVALTSIAVIGWSFLMQGQCLSEHFQLIERIMAEVRRIREDRGMSTEGN